MTLHHPAVRNSFGLKIAILAAILLSHIVPSVVIGFGFVIPGSCIEGINPYTLGYIACLAGFVPTFVFGVLAAWQFGRQDVGKASSADAARG